jgi:uncharacterized membrane-anchored protein YjiN (DUF445 family)
MQNQISSVYFHSDHVKQSELNRMKIIATALLGLAAIVFVVASVYEKQYAWVGFIRAAAEASMVGAIADWFAVTALFRHPLGLKIPHTAIIPRRKDSLAFNFGQFMQNNFLTEQVVTDWLHSQDVTKSTANWLSQPRNSQAVADFLAAAIRGVLEVVNDEAVQTIIENSLVTQIRAAQISPLLGNTLGMLLSGQRQQELFDGLVYAGANVLDENKDAIREKISAETPWWLPDAVDNQIYVKIITTLDDTLQEIKNDPAHPMQQQFSDMVAQFVEDLKTSPEFIERGERLKEEFLEDPGIQDFSSSLWQDIKTALLEYSHNPDSNLRAPMQQAIQELGQMLQQDQAMSAKIDQWVTDSARYLVRAYGHEIGNMITQTIIDWDAEATAQKIELQVGKDLQYIRINGTIVGGLVGLLIHTITVIFL